MKTIILAHLLLLSSCALYQDYKDAEFNWLGSGKATKTTNTEAPQPVIAEKKVAAVPFEEMISKNWDYSQRKDPITEVITFEATTMTLEKDATLTVLKNDQGQTAIVMGLNNEQVSYREGHSVEMKLDGISEIQQVEASEGKASKELKFVGSEALALRLADKKELIIEVNLNGKGNKRFRFDVSGLQKFFTTT